MWHLFLRSERFTFCFVNAGDEVAGSFDVTEKIEEEELKAKFEAWKSKTYALSVPLRVVALRGSIPPSWVKVCHNMFYWMF